MLKYDENSFRETARAVIKLNPHAGHFTVDSLVSYMKGMSEREVSDYPSYVGTLGFYVTTFNHPSGGLGAIATVMASLIVGPEG